MFEWIRWARFEATHGRGVASVPADAPVLADHFPGAPVLPGSLQIELCAQLAGPLAERAVASQHHLERWAFLGLVRNAAFVRPVPLPADLAIIVEIKRVETTNVVVEAAMMVGAGPGRTEQVCRAELVMVMREVEPTWVGAIADAKARVARWEQAS